MQMSQPITPADQLLAKCEILRVLSGEGYYKFKAVRAPWRRRTRAKQRMQSRIPLTSQPVKSRRGFQEISILCDPSSRVVLYVTNKWFKEMYAEDTHGSKGTRQCPWSRQCSVSSLIGPRDWLRKRFGVVTALRGSLHAAVRQRSSSMWSAAALFGTAGVSPGTKRVQGAPRGLLSSFQQKRMMKGDSLTRDRFVSDLAAAQPLHFAYIAQQVNTAQAQLSSYVRALRAMRCCRPWHRTGLV